MTRAAEPVRFDVERREPRCRICRDERVRLLVNGLLDWRGVLIPSEPGKWHRITYTDILCALQPLNEGRDKRDRLSYGCLWVHAKRHYELAGKVAYWTARITKEFRNALQE